MKIIDLLKIFIVVCLFQSVFLKTKKNAKSFLNKLRKISTEQDAMIDLLQTAEKTLMTSYDQIKNELNSETSEETNSNGACLAKLTDEEIDAKFKSFLDKDKIDAATKIKFYNKIRFIYGPCSPIVVVPGLMATRLNAVVDCKKAKADTEFAAKMKLYCGKQMICPDDKTYAYPFWPNANVTGFYMLIDKANPYNTCFSFFFLIYNRSLSCSKDTSDDTKCYYNDFVRIVPVFTEEDVNKEGTSSLAVAKNLKFQCGFGAINNILTFYFSYLQNIVNSYGGATKGFFEIHKYLKSLGYIEGFSMAAIPYDFREQYCVNEYMGMSLDRMVHHLKEQTLKKVIVVAHSYGTVNSYYQITKDKSPGRKRMRKENLAHLILIAPPLTGVVKTALFIHRGSEEFKVSLGLGKTLDFSRFAQSISLYNTGATYGLFRYNSLETILAGNKEMQPLVDAIKEAIKAKTCSMREGSDCTKLDKLKLYKEDMFKNEFKFIFDENFCKVSEQNLNYRATLFDSNKLLDADIALKPLTNPCDFKFFDFVNCSTAAETKTKVNFTEKEKDKKILDILCPSETKPEKEVKAKRKNKKFKKSEHQKNKKLYRPVDSTPIRKYSNTGEEGKKSLFDFIKEMSVLPEKYKEYLELCKITFDTTTVEDCKKKAPFLEMFTRESLSKVINKYKNLCIGEKSNQDLEHPDVKVTGIFNRSFETRGAILARSEEDIEPQSRSENLYVGGDGTVEGDSAFIPLLKWLYEEKTKSKPKVNILDYCTPSKTSDYHYKDFSSFTKSSYNLLQCNCIDESTGYYKKNMGETCAHAGMLDDPNISKVIGDIAQNEQAPFDISKEDKITYSDIYTSLSTYKDIAENICVSIYHDLYFTDSNFGPLTYSHNQRKRKFKKGKK